MSAPFYRYFLGLSYLNQNIHQEHCYFLRCWTNSLHFCSTITPILIFMLSKPSRWFQTASNNSIQCIEVSQILWYIETCYFKQRQRWAGYTQYRNIKDLVKSPNNIEVGYVTRLFAVSIHHSQAISFNWIFRSYYRHCPSLLNSSN